MTLSRQYTSKNIYRDCKSNIRKLQNNQDRPSDKNFVTLNMIVVLHEKEKAREMKI